MIRTLGAVVMAASTFAGDFKGMTFEYTDGNKLTVPVDGLTISPGTNSLTVNSSIGQTEIPMANLRQFCFVSDLSGVAAAEIEDTAGAVDAYTAAGIHAGTFNSVAEAEAYLPAGIYMLKSSGKAIKTVVR